MTVTRADGEQAPEESAEPVEPADAGGAGAPRMRGTIPDRRTK
jgi:hypothetical protein